MLSRFGRYSDALVCHLATSRRVDTKTFKLIATSSYVGYESPISFIKEENCAQESGNLGCSLVLPFLLVLICLVDMLLERSLAHLTTLIDRTGTAKPPPPPIPTSKPLSGQMSPMLYKPHVGQDKAHQIFCPGLPPSLSRLYFTLVLHRVLPIPEGWQNSTKATACSNTSIGGPNGSGVSSSSHQPPGFSGLESDFRLEDSSGIWSGQGPGDGLLSLQQLEKAQDEYASLQLLANNLGCTLTPLAYFESIHTLLAQSVHVPPPPPIPLQEHSQPTPSSSILPPPRDPNVSRANFSPSMSSDPYYSNSRYNPYYG
jgi:hypothetical protein